MGKYKRGFTQILNCIAFTIHNERNKAKGFEWGLQLEIYKFVQFHRLQTFREVVEWVLWVERGIVMLPEEREAYDKDKEKKYTTKGSSR